MLKERLVKYRYILLATCVSLVFAFYYSHVFKVDFAEQTQAFQSKFTEQEEQTEARKRKVILTISFLK